MDRREFVQKAAIGMAAVIAAPAIIPLKLGAAEPTGFHIMRMANHPEGNFLAGCRAQPFTWERVDWFDLVPGDVVATVKFPTGKSMVMQIEELPTFDEYGMEFVLVTTCQEMKSAA